MIAHFSLEQIDEVVKAIRARTSYRPRVSIILGSGLNGLADSVEKPDVIPFGDLPHFPVSTVIGTRGPFGDWHIGRANRICHAGADSFL